MGEEIELGKLAQQVHEANAKWWHDLETGAPLKRNTGELMMLITSEIAEAMEGERKGLQDDKLPHRPMAEVEMADTLIRVLDYVGHKRLAPQRVFAREDAYPFETNNRGDMLFQMTKAVVRIQHAAYYNMDASLCYEIESLIWLIESYCAQCGYDLWGAYLAKLEYNKTRADHQADARKAEGGKKW